MNYFVVLIVITFIVLIHCKTIQTTHPILHSSNIINNSIDECGKYYDKSQFLYKSLNSYFKELSHGEKRLIGNIDDKDVCKKEIYTRDTIDEILKIDLNQIVGLVLNKVNDNNLFTLSLVGYENAIILKDKHKNRRYIIDFLVNDKITHYGLRLKMDVVKFAIQGETSNDGKDGLGTVGNRDGVFTAPAFHRYYPGYPTLEQMIPLPTDVIPTGRMVIGGCGKETIIPVPFRYLHINSVVIENSTWTLDIANRCNTSCDVEGVHNTSLEFGIETRRNDGTNVGPFIPYFTKRNKWPKMDDEPTDEHSTPCPYPDGVCWDDVGIPVEKKDMIKNTCLGKVSATTKYPTRPNYWPSNYSLPQNSGEYFWLFDRTRGDYAMPTKK